MKRFRFISLFLTLAIVISLMMPSSYAASSLVKKMSVEAKAALLEDLDSDTVLYAQKADEKVYPGQPDQGYDRAAGL